MQKHILQINSSIRGADANSTRLANDITARLRRAHPDASLVVRDITNPVLSSCDAFALGALMTAPEARSPMQAARVAEDDALIAELQSADILVLGVPMYNFSIPAQFKNWIDAVTRRAVTFRYTATGPEGLLKNKRVFVALARGGRYRDTAADTQVPYLKCALGFIGLTDISFVYAEGLNMGEAAITEAWRLANEDMNRVLGA